MSKLKEIWGNKIVVSPGFEPLELPNRCVICNANAEKRFKKTKTLTYSICEPHLRRKKIFTFVVSVLALTAVVMMVLLYFLVTGDISNLTGYATEISLTFALCLVLSIVFGVLFLWPMRLVKREDSGQEIYRVGRAFTNGLKEQSNEDLSPELKSPNAYAAKISGSITSGAALLIFIGLTKFNIPGNNKYLLGLIFIVTLSSLSYGVAYLKVRAENASRK